MTFTSIVEQVGTALDAIGVVVMVGGLMVAGVAAIRRWRRGEGEVYRYLRREVGRSILLGLELLVAGDIIRTVAATPTLTSLAVLAGIVAIRTFLSFSLELEVSGSWPWQRNPADQSQS
jgi:uncharacterized membrane protein